MPDVDSSSKPSLPPPPQISEMFQKFALAFKTKTFEFFTEEEELEHLELCSLLDSSEEFITGQRVVVLKPDNLNPDLPEETQIEPKPEPEPEPLPEELRVPSPVPAKRSQISQAQIKPLNTQFGNSLISSLFATLSSFQSAYLQLQTAHVPFHRENIVAADKTIVSHLNKLSELRKLYVDSRCDPDFNPYSSTASCLEARVEENQSKLRALGTVSNALQLEMDAKDSQVLYLKNELEGIKSVSAKLSKRVPLEFNSSIDSCSDVILSVRVFDSVLHDCFGMACKFTKLLISLMRKGGWDLDLAANSVYSDVCYSKKEDNRYAFLSYVCLVMFRGFDAASFGFLDGENDKDSSSLRKMIEHVCSNPLEILRKNPSCGFARFCESKYQELIHPTMESSIFSNLEQDKVVLDSWRSLSHFYESFVDMASSVWTLNKLAFSFDPPVGIFQVEGGTDFSIVYMEDVKKKPTLTHNSRGRVGFTVVPGFKIGRTVIQAQVYLSAMECIE